MRASSASSAARHAGAAGLEGFCGTGAEDGSGAVGGRAARSWAPALAAPATPFAPPPLTMAVVTTGGAETVSISIQVVRPHDRFEHRSIVRVGRVGDAELQRCAAEGAAP